MDGSIETSNNISLPLRNIRSFNDKGNDKIFVGVDSCVNDLYCDKLCVKKESQNDANKAVVKELVGVQLEPTLLFYDNPVGKTGKNNGSPISNKSSITKVLREVKILRRDRYTKSNGGNDSQTVQCTLLNAEVSYNTTEHTKKKEKSCRVESPASESTEDINKNNCGKLKDRYECADCGKVFREKSHLATHFRAHINIRNFKCSLCDLSFKTKTNLSFHFRTHSDTPFTCKECNKTYSERKTLNRHIRIVHSSNERYICDQCGKTFKSSANLSLHYTLHTGSKPFSCSICPKSFVYKSTYVAHLKIHRSGQEFKCNTCPDKKSCQHHCEARPWLCTICGKGYPLKGTLKNHMKSHNPEKPFKCSECPKSFMKRQSLECHIKAEHRGERPEFMCDQCSQSYFNVFALKRHYLKHTSEKSFSCDTCGRAFWMKDALKVHMRSHSSVKSYTCPHCPRAFVHKHSLNAHLRTHIGAQPYSCNVCGKSFIHKYNLSRHGRQHQESVNREQIFIKQTSDHTLQVL